MDSAIYIDLVVIAITAEKKLSRWKTHKTVVTLVINAIAQNLTVKDVSAITCMLSSWNRGEK